MLNNGDEGITTDLKFDDLAGPNVIGIGNFHKTLPHNKFGEVDPAAYEAFRLAATANGDYETVPPGFKGVVIPPEAGFAPTITAIPHVSDRFNNPLSARNVDRITGAPTDFMMPPAPGVRSISTAAEMTELQWMAWLRDLPFADFSSSVDVASAITELSTRFDSAQATGELDGLQLIRDLPTKNNALDLRLNTLFRCGLPGEDIGPIISQFFLHDIAYGAQFITQVVRPYRKDRDFLTNHGDWLRAQNAGLDEWGHGYANDNDFDFDPGFEELVNGKVTMRHISTMRDLARFVNKDALHQAYFNAALLCLNWKIPMGPGLPYGTYGRQAPFATFGGPDVLTRVSEVASRALSIVWRQKWEIHRRLRPEAYGGLMQMQRKGFGSIKRAYGLPEEVFTSVVTGKLTGKHNGDYFLPIAFSAGSPPHPSYGAGHATVAGACVTVLKAWFDGTTRLEKHLADVRAHSPSTNYPNDPVKISEPDAAGALIRYANPSVSAQITVEGELNKIACNVAMGRSMGGVHFRSDNTRSLRLGEQIAAEIIRLESLGYNERRKPDNSSPFWTFRSFNGNRVKIFDGSVYVENVKVDPKVGPL